VPFSVKFILDFESSFRVFSSKKAIISSNKLRRSQMAKRTAKQWMVNIVLILATLSLLGASMLPLVGQIFSSSNQANTPAPTAEKPENENVRIQMQGYEEILKTEPDNQFALQQLSNLHLRLAELGDVKSLAGVIQPLNRLAELNPKENGYRLQLGRVKAYLKDKEGAIAEYRKILTTAPGNIDALKSLVSIELAEKRPEAAIGVLDQAIAGADNANKIQPNSVDKPAITLLKADLFLSQKRFDDARSIYEAIAKANVKDFRPVLGKGLLARAEGNEEIAKGFFETAAKLAPPEYRDEVNKLAAQPIQPVKPSNQSENTPAPNPAAKPIEQTTNQVPIKPEKSTEKSIEKSTEKPVEKPLEKPVQN
jgi:tetratricopeptide (TPR) repeat protein